MNEELSLYLPGRSTMASATSLSLNRFAGLDTLRAFAIVMVMLYHFGLQDFLPQSLVPFAAVGWIGVDLFFVLSGFLIGSQLIKPGQTATFSSFYARRAYRILPAFAVVLLLYLTVPLWKEAPGPYAPLQYVTFTWNLLLLHYPYNRAFSHIWSLCVEEHFYLLLPLLLLALRRLRSKWIPAALLVGLLVGGVCLRAWLLHHLILVPDVEEDAYSIRMMRFIYLPTYSRLDGLVVGVGLATIRNFKPALWLRLTDAGHTTLIAGLLLVTAALWTCDFGFITLERPASIFFAFPLLAFGFGFLVLSAVSQQGVLRRSVPGASAVAVLAFSLYLTHKAVAHVVHVTLPTLTADAGWLPLSLYFAASLGTASLLYFAVERPFLRLRLSRNSRPETAAEIKLDPAL